MAKNNKFFFIFLISIFIGTIGISSTLFIQLEGLKALSLWVGLSLLGVIALIINAFTYHE